MTTRTERNEEKQKEIIREENRELRKKIVLTSLKIIFIVIIISISFFLYTTYISSKLITVKEENRELRKKIVLTSLKIIFIVIIISISFFLYTTYISSKLITVKEERIIDEKIPESFDGLKIIQLSDIHYGSTIFMDDIKELVKMINRRNPDLVVFTGDLINKNYKLKSKEQETLINELKKIKSTIGKYAIFGEEDKEQFTTIMNQSEFTILNNSYELIYNNSNTPILLIGLNSSISGNININQAYQYFEEPTHDSNIYTITLLHEPDIVDDITASYQTNLFLAGHSHNGQVVIPYFGGIFKKEGATKYINPFYQLEQSKLYISSGIGTIDNGFRLFCRPSINFFRLSRK